MLKQTKIDYYYSLYITYFV